MGLPPCPCWAEAAQPAHAWGHLNPIANTGLWLFGRMDGFSPFDMGKAERKPWEKLTLVD